MNKYLIGLALLVAMFSCNNDDDGPSVEPIRERGPQAIADDEILQNFLSTHTYNDLDFKVADHELTNNDIVFYKLTDGKLPEGTDMNKTSGKPLIELDELKKVKFTEANTEQTLYVLQIREGEGRPVSRLDDVKVSFRGNRINNSEEKVTSINSEIFEGSATDVGWLALFIDTTRQSIPGLAIGISQFKTASSESTKGEQVCGVFDIDTTGKEKIKNNDFGIGALFVPSGLGFYGRINGLTREYNNLVYTFSLFNVDYRDHDSDGIFSMLEDLNGNLNFFDDDTDNNGAPNFLDNNDDGDDKATEDEIIILDNPEIDFDCDGIPTNDNEGIDMTKPDVNNNGIPDFLDKEA
ncbi:hypothetical protein [Aquimarina agarilytica]|uniref:hypothetical protein n=1 Tax=Aquimarina agarilytica TaxID=1087449 RepID=UPI00028A13FA|nr:hypothetical protein [Aquimarina agarilytica]